jgi:hypothetical protein
MIAVYDKAIVTKFKSWIHDDSVKVFSPEDNERMFQTRSFNENDNPVPLPFISITRDPSFTYVSRKKLAREGLTLDKSTESAMSLNAIPITLSYQLDIYTRYSVEGSNYLANFIFNLVKHPKITFTITDNNLNHTYNCNLVPTGTAVDNSDLPNHFVNDQFTRWTLAFTVDTYLYNANIYEQAVLDTIQLVDNN